MLATSRSLTQAHLSHGVTLLEDTASLGCRCQDGSSRPAVKEASHSSSGSFSFPALPAAISDARPGPAGAAWILGYFSPGGRVLVSVGVRRLSHSGGVIQGSVMGSAGLFHAVSSAGEQVHASGWTEMGMYVGDSALHAHHPLEMRQSTEIFPATHHCSGRLLSVWAVCSSGN